VNLLGDNIHTIKKDIETLIDVSEEVGLEVNAEKTKYILLSRHRNAEKYHDTNVANGSFENVALFMCLAARVTNQYILSSRLMTKYLQIKLYKSKILLVVLCGCKTLPVALREEHTLRVSEERGLRKFLKRRDRKYSMVGEYCIV
jgi:hypothetical protein